MGDFMKKLLLSLLLIYPALGFAGGGAVKYGKGTVVPLSNGDIGTVISFDTYSARVRSNNWTIPGLLYKEYNLKSELNSEGDLVLNPKPDKTITKVGVPAKLAAIGVILASAHLGASSYFGDAYSKELAKVTEFLSKQKDALVDATSPVLTSVNEIVLKPIGNAVSTAVGTVSEAFKRLAGFVSSTPSNTSKSFHPKSWGRGVDGILS